MIRYLLLKLMGWDTNIPLGGDNHMPFVGCLSHTSKFDAFLLVLYGYHPFFSKSLTVMMPQCFTYFSWLFRRLRFIPSPRLEDSGNNFVKSTTELLKQNNKNILFISPEGTIKAKKWRSGYFWLARELYWDIRVCGFDYKTKRIVISQPYKRYYYPSQESIESRLLNSMSKITPLYPQNCYANVIENTNNKKQKKIKINYKYAIPLILTTCILCCPIFCIFIK